MKWSTHGNVVTTTVCERSVEMHLESGKQPQECVGMLVGYRQVQCEPVNAVKVITAHDFVTEDNMTSF